MTPREQTAVAFIHSHLASKGYSPTFAEVGERVGLPKGAALNRLLWRLRARGAIDWTRYRARSFAVLRPPVAYHQITACPDCGDVIAPDGVCPGCEQILPREAA